MLDPWLSTPTTAKTQEDEWSGHVVEIARFVDGPADATGADQTVLMHGPSATERRLHLRLPAGAQVPLFRNEAVKIRTFSRLAGNGSVQRSVIVSARRPLGTGADFKPVVVVAAAEDLIPPDALPRLLTNIARTEQVAYREARKDQGECTLQITHYFVTAGVDAPALSLANHRRPTYPPGARIRRQDHDATYDLTIHDARRSSLAPCPSPDESALLWTAVWVEEDATKGAPKAVATAAESVVLPLAPTPTAPTGAPGHPAARKARKTAPPRP